MTLRPAVAGDLEALCELLWLPDVRRYLCDDRCLPRTMIAGGLERSAELDSRGLGSWLLEEGGPAAGFFALQPAGVLAGCEAVLRDAVELIAALRPSWQGRGLATAACRALLAHAGSACGLTRVVASVDLPNRASQALMGRCGFRLVGRATGPLHEALLYQADLPLAGEAGGVETEEGRRRAPGGCR